MIPHDLLESERSLPPGDRHSAVLLTGSSLRHLQYGYRLQEELPGFVKKWWIHRAPASADNRRLSVDGMQRAADMLRQRHWRSLAKAVVGRARSEVAAARRNSRQSAAEERFFGRQVRAAEARAEILPVPVANLNDDAIYREVTETSPYFLLSLGGPLLRRRLIEAPRGLAINQHSGWSPEMKGGNCVHAALYQRRADRVGITVHLLSTAADAGDIIRRTAAKLHPEDSTEDCFMAALALGTQLMIQTIEVLLQADTLLVYAQPHGGTTYLADDFDDAMRERIQTDMTSGWLAEALARGRAW